MIQQRGVSPLKLEIFRRGLVQVDVANKADLGESRLSRILNGRVTPEEYELKNIAKALGISREELPT